MSKLVQNLHVLEKGYASVPKKTKFIPTGELVEVISMGHFPDTLMVQFADDASKHKFEVYLHELER